MRPQEGVELGGRYRLTSRIATGGMGEVWRAQDGVLGREVAVKILKEEYTGDAGFLDRFRAEARHTAALSHPNIAGVYDYGEADHSAYLVMELVPGEPMSDLLAERGSLPPRETAGLLAQAADGIAAAHAAGLVHRDVKPGNLLVMPDGRVKVTDFGIARAGGQVPLTATGQVMGTAQYLAPEQATGHAATPSSDVYALGVVAFESLAGVRPFTGESQVAVAMAHVNQDPPPLPDDVTGAMRDLVVAAMAKDPSGRPPDAATFAEVARAVAAGDEAGAARVLAAAGLGAAAGAATTAWGTTDATTAMPGGGYDPDATRVAAGPAAAAAAEGPPTGTSPTSSTTTGDGEPGRRGLSGPLLALLLLLVLVAVGAALVTAGLLGGDDPATDPAPTQTSQPSATDSQQPTSSPSTSSAPPDTPDEPTTIDLDPADYVGRDVDVVASELEALGLAVDETSEPSSAPENTVVSLSPTSGLSEGDTVTVVAAAPQDEDTPTQTPTDTSSPTTTQTDNSGSGSDNSGSGSDDSGSGSGNSGGGSDDSGSGSGSDTGQGAPTTGDGNATADDGSGTGDGSSTGDSATGGNNGNGNGNGSSNDNAGGNGNGNAADGAVPDQGSVAGGAIAPAPGPDSGGAPGVGG